MFLTTSERDRFETIRTAVKLWRDNISAHGFYRLPIPKEIQFLTGFHRVTREEIKKAVNNLKEVN